MATIPSASLTSSDGGGVIQIVPPAADLSQERRGGDSHRRQRCTFDFHEQFTEMHNGKGSYCGSERFQSAFTLEVCRMESSSRNIASSSGLEEVADGGVKEEDGSFDIARLMPKIFVVARWPRDAVGEEWHQGGRRG